MHIYIYTHSYAVPLRYLHPWSRHLWSTDEPRLCDPVHAAGLDAWRFAARIHCCAADWFRIHLVLFALVEGRPEGFDISEWYIALWNAIVGIVGISLVFSSRKNNEMWLFTSFHVNQYRQKESQQRVFWQMWIDSAASKARKMTYCIHTYIHIYIYLCVCVSVSLSARMSLSSFLLPRGAHADWRLCWLWRVDEQCHGGVGKKRHQHLHRLVAVRHLLYLFYCRMHAAAKHRLS